MSIRIRVSTWNSNENTYSKGRAPKQMYRVVPITKNGGNTRYKLTWRIGHSGILAFSPHVSVPVISVVVDSMYKSRGIGDTSKVVRNEYETGSDRSFNISSLIRALISASAANVKGSRVSRVYSYTIISISVSMYRGNTSNIHTCIVNTITKQYVYTREREWHT